MTGKEHNASYERNLSVTLNWSKFCHLNKLLVLCEALDIIIFTMRKSVYYQLFYCK